RLTRPLRPYRHSRLTFFLNARPSTDIYTLSLHDALPIFSPGKPPSVLAVTSYESGEGKTATAEGLARAAARHGARVLLVDGDLRDRKSTRLNSSHVAISYAVFCLKKKKTLVRATPRVPAA